MGTALDQMRAQIDAARGARGAAPLTDAQSGITPLDQLKQQIDAARQAEEQGPKAQGPLENFGAGLRAGFDNLKGMGYGLAALAGDAVGSDELHNWGMEGYKNQLDEASKEGVRVEGMHSIKGVRDLIDYTASMAGESIPSLMQMAAGGGVGGVIAKKMVAHQIEDTLVKHGVESLVEKGLTKEMAEKALKGAVEKQMFGAGLEHTVRSEALGASLGAAAANYPNNLASIYAQIKSDPAAKEAIPEALVGALGMSVLEAAPFAAGASTIAKAAVEAQAKGVAKENLMSLGQRMLHEAPKMAAIMGGTGVAETALTLGLHTMANPNFDWKSPDAQQQMLDALGGGALMGTLMGVGTGGLAHLMSRNARIAARANGEELPETGTLNTTENTGAPHPADMPAADPTKTGNYTPEMTDTAEPDRSHRSSEVDAEAMHEGAMGVTNEGVPLRFVGKNSTYADEEGGAAPWASGSHNAPGDVGGTSTPVKLLQALGDKNPDGIQHFIQSGLVERGEDGKIKITDLGKEMIRRTGMDVPDPDSTLMKTKRAYEALNQGMEYTPHQLESGHWLLAETSKDLMSPSIETMMSGRSEWKQDAKTGRFTYQDGGKVPTSEVVGREMNEAERQARGHDKNGREKHNQEFEVVSDRAQRQWDEKYTQREAELMHQASLSGGGEVDRNTVRAMIERELGPRPGLEAVQSKNGKGEDVNATVRLSAPHLTRLGIRMMGPEKFKIDPLSLRKRGFLRGVDEVAHHPYQTREDENGKPYNQFLRHKVERDRNGNAVMGSDRVIYDSTNRDSGEQDTTHWRDVAKLANNTETARGGPKGDEGIFHEGDGTRHTVEQLQRALHGEGGAMETLAGANKEFTAAMHEFRDATPLGQKLNRGLIDLYKARKKAEIVQGKDSPEWVARDAAVQHYIHTVMEPAMRKQGGYELLFKKREIASRNVGKLFSAIEQHDQTRGQVNDTTPAGRNPDQHMENIPTEYDQANNRTERGITMSKGEAAPDSGASQPPPWQPRDANDLTHKLVDKVMKLVGVKGEARTVQLTRPELSGFKKMSTAGRAKLVRDLIGYDSLANKLGSKKASEIADLVTDKITMGEQGFYVSHGSGEDAFHFVYIDPRLSRDERITAVSHEVGHLVKDEHYESATGETKEALHAAHADYAKAQRVKPQTFDEWMANQFVHWVANTEAPRSIIESFFQKGAELLKKTWDMLTKQHRLTTPFKDWMDAITKKSSFTEQLRTGGTGRSDAAAFTSLGRVSEPAWEGLPGAPPGRAADGSWQGFGGQLEPQSRVQTLAHLPDWATRESRVLLGRDTKIGPERATAGWGEEMTREGDWTPEKSANQAIEHMKGWIKRSAKLTDLAKTVKWVVDRGIRSMDSLVRQVPGSTEYAKSFLLRPGEAGLHGGSETHPMELARARKDSAQRVAGVRTLIEHAANDKIGSEAYKAHNDMLIAELERLDGTKGEPNLPPKLMPAFKALRSYLDKYAIGRLEVTDTPHGEVKSNYWMRVLDREAISSPEAKADILEGAMKFFKCDEEQARNIFSFLLNDEHVFGGTMAEAPLQATIQDMKSPVAQALRSREIPKEFWDQVLNKYREKDLASSLQRYGNQLAARTTYTKWFGMTSREYKRHIEGDVWDRERGHFVPGKDGSWEERRDAAITKIQAESPGINIDTAKELANVRVPKPSYDPHYKFHRMLGDMRAEKADDRAIRMVTSAHERYLGMVGKDTDEAVKRIMNAGMAYTAMRTLGLAVFGSLFDVIGPGVRVGSLRLNMQAVMKLATDPAARERAKVGLQSMGKWIDHFSETVAMDGAHSDVSYHGLMKASEAFFKYTGMQGLDNFTRQIGWHAGREAIIEHAEQSLKGNKSSAEFLRELNL
jgi:hypothetical protein